MKKTFTIFTLLSFLSFVAYSQNKTVAEPKKAVSGPVMEFQTTEIDYGQIVQNADPLRVFTFKNTGTEPLVITNAQGSCGCTVPAWPKEPILPGETSKVEVRYATDRIGQFHKTVTLTTNEAEGTHVLTIKGKVDPKPEGVDKGNGN